MLPISELVDIRSAIEPSAAIPANFAPLGIKCIILAPFLPYPASLAALYACKPVLAVSPAALSPALPIPPVAVAKTPNSTNPLTRLPKPDSFSGA